MAVYKWFVVRETKRSDENIEHFFPSIQNCQSRSWSCECSVSPGGEEEGNEECCYGELMNDVEIRLHACRLYNEVAKLIACSTHIRR